MAQEIAIQVNYIFTRLSDEALEWLNEHYPHKDDYLDERDNKALIHCIKELGGYTVGKNSAEFKIVEIPDDVEWEIRGNRVGEKIVEKHRTWK